MALVLTHLRPLGLTILTNLTSLYAILGMYGGTFYSHLKEHSVSIK